MLWSVQNAKRPRLGGIVAAESIRGIHHMVRMKCPQGQSAIPIMSTCMEEESVENVETSILLAPNTFTLGNTVFVLTRIGVPIKLK